MHIYIYIYILYIIYQCKFDMNLLILSKLVKDKLVKELHFQNVHLVFWNKYVYNVYVYVWMWICIYQGLIQKEKVHVNGEKGPQINILASKIATQWWLNIIINKSKQIIHYIHFLFSHYYVADLIKNLELHLMVVSVLLETEIGHPPN